MHITSATFIKGIIGTDDILTDGKPQIAFVGRSNVGKSSVINALVGQGDLVKVGKKPGKTTEINFFLVNKKYYFVDLPGYGFANLNPLEKEKIGKRMMWYLAESGVRLHRVILIVDVRAGLTELDCEMVKLINKIGYPLVIVANKVDKLNQRQALHQLATIREMADGVVVIPFSAVLKEGIREALKAIL